METRPRSEQSIEEEIARALHTGIVKAAREDRIIIEVFDETPGFDFELDLAKSLSPLLNRVRAEALREAADQLNHQMRRGMLDPVKHLELHAVRIEQNSEGNEA